MARSRRSLVEALKVVADIEIMLVENIEAPAQNRMFSLFHRHNLYIGFKAHDPEPDKIRAFYNDTG
jgi:hypothetical protein